MKNSNQEIRTSSPAFRKALLESERLRLRIIIATIAAVFVIRAVRIALLMSRESLYPWLLTNLFLAVFAIYELLMLRAVNRSIRSGGDLPRTAWIAGIVLETCVPAFALVIFSGGAIEAAYKPLANPAVLLYFIFIILSTLRLDPNISRLSGIVAAVSYVAAAAYLGWVPRLIGGTTLLTPERAVGGFAI